MASSIFYGTVSVPSLPARYALVILPGNTIFLQQPEYRHHRCNAERKTSYYTTGRIAGDNQAPFSTPVPITISSNLTIKRRLPAQPAMDVSAQGQCDLYTDLLQGSGCNPSAFPGGTFKLKRRQLLFPIPRANASHLLHHPMGPTPTLSSHSLQPVPIRNQHETSLITAMGDSAPASQIACRDSQT